MASTTMKYKDFSAQIMEAPRLTGDIVHRLPPGSALPVYPVDAFLKVPETWMKGQGVFVVPVRPNKGLWFNWRMNSETNTAIIPTVKGCNPITGLQTSGFHLEKYENKCPKHNVDFMADRFCPKCNYKWPDRNYVSMSPSWWDGFRAEDGTVRQFFFTEDELRDVATAMIGKENTVPAFGFAFYSPKERRPDITVSNYGGSHLLFSAPVKESFNLMGVDFSYGNSSDSNPPMIYLNSVANSTGAQITPTSASYCCNTMNAIGAAAAPAEEVTKCSAPSKSLSMQTKSMRFSKMSTRSKGLTKGGSIGGQMICDSFDVDSLQERGIQLQKEVKDVSIGAGAKIDQALPVDSYALDSWKNVPDAVMTIYFVFHEKFEELKAGGMRDFKEVENGMLAGLPVG